MEWSDGLLTLAPVLPILYSLILSILHLASWKPNQGFSCMEENLGSSLQQRRKKSLAL